MANSVPSTLARALAPAIAEMMFEVGDVYLLAMACLFPPYDQDIVQSSIVTSWSVRLAIPTSNSISRISLVG